MTLDEVMKWLGEQDEATLDKVASDLIERGYADPLSDEGEDEWSDDDPDIDLSALEEARACLDRRNWPETMHQLARALGRDFLALDDAPLRTREPA